jgi:TonB family protein
MKKGEKVGALVVRNFGSAIADSCRWIGSSIAEGIRSFPLVSGNFGKSIWGIVKNRDLSIGFGSAVLLHFLLFLLFMPRGSTTVTEYPLVEEIKFLDSSYPPQVAKVVTGGGGFNGTKISGEELPAGLAEAPDLMRKIDRTQIAVNLDRYAPAGAITDIIRISKRGEGGGLTTAEILAEAPISLRNAAPPGFGGSEGIFPTRGPGGGIGKPIDLTGREPASKIAPQVIRSASPANGNPKNNQTAIITGETPIRIGYIVAGPLKGRQIVAKVLPEYPEWARARGLSDVEITMRIEVTPDGTVRTNVMLDRSSGYPQWDQIAMAALGRWQFAPLAADARPEIQWGEITFIFRLTF